MVGFVRFIIYKGVRDMDLKNMTAKEVRDCIMEHSKGIRMMSGLKLVNGLAIF